jgi:hypothetical protein
MTSQEPEVYYLIAKGMKEGKDSELGEKVEAGASSAEMMRVSEVGSLETSMMWIAS